MILGITMDMFDMKAFEDASFDIVLDKGTMDAILVSRCSNVDPIPRHHFYHIKIAT